MIVVTKRTLSKNYGEPGYINWLGTQKSKRQRVERLLPDTPGCGTPVGLGEWGENGFVQVYGQKFYNIAAEIEIIHRTHAIERKYLALITGNYIGFVGKIKQALHLIYFFRLHLELDQLYIDLFGSQDAHIELIYVSAANFAKARIEALREIISNEILIDGRNFVCDEA